MQTSFPYVPTLELVDVGGVRVWTDHGLREHMGVVIGFSERVGGESDPPFASLNLGAHVGDEPVRVDSNRERLLDALGMRAHISRLTTAEQIHGPDVAWVTEALAGNGARAAEVSNAVAGVDALITDLPETPLLLCFADCVPVVLVGPGPVIGVVHAGWRGALNRIPGAAVRAMCSRAGCSADAVTAYIGPHIGACCYEVGDETMSLFVNSFDTFARAHSGALDLDAVVRHSLTDAGVSQWRITSLGACTADETHRFFSYRAEQGLTGRHGALACIVS